MSTQNTAPASTTDQSPESGRIQQHRRYLMCRPEHFTVSYTINPWMEPANPTDTARALRQWQALYDTYIALGHEVHLIDPIHGLPDMVYTANGGFVIDGVAYGAKFRFQERVPEGPAFMEWFGANGFEVVEPAEVNEGEGDFLLVGDTILAGTGFRSTGDSHRELADVFGREVVSLTLVDPRFYHLDTAISVLDPVEGPGGVEKANIAYLEQAFDDFGEMRKALEEQLGDLGTSGTSSPSKSSAAKAAAAPKAKAAQPQKKSDVDFDDSEEEDEDFDDTEGGDDEDDDEDEDFDDSE